MPGGKRKVDPSDAEVQAAVDFAVTSIASATNSMYKPKLQKVHRAEVQVVAGLNYYLTLEMKTDENGRTSYHEVVVYRDLQGQHHLSSHHPRQTLDA
jgi:hypothetical protein